MIVVLVCDHRLKKGLSGDYFDDEETQAKYALCRKCKKAFDNGEEMDLNELTINASTISGEPN